MPDEPSSEQVKSDPENGPPGIGAGSVNDPDAKASDDSQPKALTPEEQMAQFEEALKEEDWGHQPC